VPTFLEALWIALYSAEVQRQYAAYASSGKTVAAGTMTQAQVDAVAASAQSMADAFVAATTPDSLAALQATVAALKPA
jgi:hypothetical protein